MRIATQPVYSSSDPDDPVNEYTDPADPLNTIINDPEAVFNFYDGFDGTSLDLTKWTPYNGTTAQAVVSGGSLTLTATGTWIRLNATSAFGMEYIGETRARHPNTPATDMIVEYLFSETQSSWNLRITDNFTTVGRWQWYVSSTSANFGPATTTGWHLYSIYRESPGTAGFLIDGSGVTVSSGVPTANLYPGLMSYGNGNQFVVDWTRVRKWAGGESTATPQTEESYFTHRWTGDVDTDWHTEDNWSGNIIPDEDSRILIPDVTNQPIISSADASCNLIVLQTGGTLEISGTNTLFVSGDWINSGGTLITGSGNVVFNGTSQLIEGSSTTFYNLTINSSQSTTLGTDLNIDGNLTVTAGIFDLGSFTCDRTSAGGTLTLDEGTSLKIGGINTSLPSDFSTYTIGTSATVDYYGEAQVVSSADYGILVLSGSGEKTFPPAGLTSIDRLIIEGSATAALADGTTSGTGKLILGGAAPLSGSYGSESSDAANKDNTFFTDGYTGIIDHDFVAGMWLGETSSDWSTAANWYGGLPGSSTDIQINPEVSYQPIISADSPHAICGDLTIADGASLTIEAGEALTVTGDLSNSGAITIESNLFANGSLIVNGSATGTGLVTYNRTMNTSGNLYHYFSSPLEIGTFPTTGTVWAYNEVTSGWDEVTSNVTGKGYTLETGIDMISFNGTLAGSDPVTYDATSPYAYDDFIDGTELNYDARTFVQSTDGSHSGAVTRSLNNYGGGGWNLLGNPYTSAISVSDFITENYSTTPSASQFDPNYVALYLYNGNEYFWVGLDDGWLNGTGMDEDHIQVGQGFFVLAMNDGSTFSFTRSMQENATDVLLLKSAQAGRDPWPGLMLDIKYGEKSSSTLIVYNENMTIGLDPGYDVGLLSSGPDVELYTVLASGDNGVNFTRQALPVEGADRIFVPVGIDSESGGEVTFSATTVPLGTFRYWLEDRANGTFTDLTTKSYTVTLPPKTYGTGRFFIIASTNTPTGIIEPGDENQGMRIWTLQNKIVIKGEVSATALCELFDVRGRKLLSYDLPDGELNTIDLPSGIRGVFFVRVTDGVKVTTRKIAVL
jgi:hypothetical protein